KIDGLLAQVGELGDLFAETNTTGAGIKQLVTLLGKTLVGDLERGVPIAKAFLQGLVIGSQRVVIGFLEARAAIRAAFPPSPPDGVDRLRLVTTLTAAAV